MVRQRAMVWAGAVLSDHFFVKKRCLAFSSLKPEGFGDRVVIDRTFSVPTKDPRYEQASRLAFSNNTWILPLEIVRTLICWARVN